MSLQLTLTPLRSFGHIVTLVGSLDTEGAPRLKQELDALIAADTPLVVLDLAGLAYVNSHGLRVLQTAMRTVERSGGALKLINATPAIERVLEIIALPMLAERFSSLEALDEYLTAEQHRLRENGGN